MGSGQDKEVSNVHHPSKLPRDAHENITTHPLHPPMNNPFPPAVAAARAQACTHQHHDDLCDRQAGGVVGRRGQPERLVVVRLTEVPKALVQLLRRGERQEPPGSDNEQHQQQGGGTGRTKEGRESTVEEEEGREDEEGAWPKGGGQGCRGGGLLFAHGFPHLYEMSFGRSANTSLAPIANAQM